MGHTVHYSSIVCFECHRLDILFCEIVLCREHLNRSISSDRFFRCFWLTPLLTRFRHSLKLDDFRDLLINLMTCCSERPNCALMASKGVRSSQAISMTLSVSSSVKERISELPTVLFILPIFLSAINKCSTHLFALSQINLPTDFL